MDGVEVFSRFFAALFGWLGFCEGWFMILRRLLLSLALVGGSVWCLGQVWEARQGAGAEAGVSRRAPGATEDSGVTRQVSTGSLWQSDRPQG